MGKRRRRSRGAKSAIRTNLKLPFYLWTREALTRLIEQRFGIRVSLSTVGRYLAHWGFTVQTPFRRAFERTPEVVARWL